MQYALLFCFLIIAFFLLQAIKSSISKERIDKRHKDLFKLSRAEVNQINRQLALIKKHFYLEFCIEEIIRIYIHTYRELPEIKKKNPVLNKLIITYCIYLLKDKYDFKPTPEDQVSALQASLPSTEIALIEKQIRQTPPPTPTEDKKLFANDNQRWKRQYDRWTQTFDSGNPSDFYEKVVRLASLNQNVRVADTRNMLYKGYVFMIGHHQATALKLYLHYLSIKSNSNTFKHKQISTRSISKLFNSTGQKEKFDAICLQFMKHEKLDKALTQIEELYTPVRKKISLRTDSIQEANTKQIQVAQLLSAYLDDEPTPEVPVSINIEQEQEKTAEDNQKELFKLFITNSYRLNQQEVHIFAQSKGLFKDQFIESINEQYYDEFDDLLIEENGEEYILNKAYYQQVFPF